jgi:hypothetical protein
MKVTVWNSGGTTYGFRVGKPNRDAFFQRAWTEIEVELDGQVHRFNLTRGFWNECAEFRSPIIREWLVRNGLQRWPKGSPPSLELSPLGNAHFRLTRV